MNNRGFILYDGLVSLILLTTFISFFTLVINLNQNYQQLANIKLSALSALRNNAYHYYVTGEYFPISTKTMKSQQTTEQYCILYQAAQEEKRVCLE